MGAPNEENFKASNHSNRRVKTVFFIRHAESDENRRRYSLNKCFVQLSTGAMPSTEDLNASFELLNLPAQLNSDVSEVGAKQIKHMGDLLQTKNFLEEKGVQLVVHSPLLRARQTCEGLLGCSAQPLKKPSSVRRVEELEFLIERQPQEIPQDVVLKDVAPTQSSFTRRIKMFEQWLADQPEDVVAVVGHSLHFKTMLGVNFKFNNCEVWESKFDPKRQEGLTEQQSNNRNPSQVFRPPWARIAPELLFRQRIGPWTGLKRVYGCDISREISSY